MTRHSFGVVRRGYDPREVRSYLELVARELAAWEEREQEYRRQLQEAKHRAQNPVLDEATITQALGQQTAAVLRKAHEEAARLVADAEERAVTLTREAQQRVTETTVQAEASGAERIAEAELAAGSVRHQAEEEARRIAEAARQEGDTVMARAREHGRLMVEEAQNARKRVLGDMAQRRRLVHVQIEQLRAARDELAAAVMSVRDRFDEITGKLATAEDEARQAAAATGQRIAADGSEYEIEVTESSDLLVHEVLSRRARGPGRGDGRGAPTGLFARNPRGGAGGAGPARGRRNRGRRTAGDGLAYWGAAHDPAADRGRAPSG